uniref:Putative secreted protein n=1 Tax=Amblyomma cajennense TaxID=34607 RepID=A0A023FB89_AMBCJ
MLMLLVNCGLVLICTDTFHNVLALNDETTTGKHIPKWYLLQPSKLYKHKLVWHFVHTEVSADVQVKTGKDQNNI